MRWVRARTSFRKSKEGRGEEERGARLLGRARFEGVESESRALLVNEGPVAKPDGAVGAVDFELALGVETVGRLEANEISALDLEEGERVEEGEAAPL